VFATTRSPLALPVRRFKPGVLTMSENGWTVTLFASRRKKKSQGNQGGPLWLDQLRSANQESVERTVPMISPVRAVLKQAVARRIELTCLRIAADLSLDVAEPLRYAHSRLNH
jgi:hypothetical protein